MLGTGWGYLLRNARKAAVYFQPQPSLCLQRANLGGSSLRLSESMGKEVRDPVPLLQLMALQQPLHAVPLLQPTLNHTLPRLGKSKVGASVHAMLQFWGVFGPSRLVFSSKNGVGLAQGVFTQGL